jgi:hypothetical protein
MRLAAFCLTKSLLYIVAILLGMSYISEMCFKFKEDSMQIPSQRSRIPSFRLNGPVMRPDAHQCQEVLNYSRLQPSGHLSNLSGHSSVFDKKSDFLLRHRCGKTTASVWMSSLHCLDAILDKARRGEEL